MVTVDRNATPARLKQRGSGSRQRRKRRPRGARRRQETAPLRRALFQKLVLEALDRLENRFHEGSAIPQSSGGDRGSGSRQGSGGRKEPEVCSRLGDRVQPVALYAELDSRGCLRVSLSEKVRQDRALMLWLHHRVVDLLADNGLLDFLYQDVEQHLALLSPDIASDYVAALLKEGVEAVASPEEEGE